MSGKQVAIVALIALGTIMALELFSNFVFDPRSLLPRKGGSTLSSMSAGENVRNATMGGNTEP